MVKINLQNKAKAKKSTAEMYWFENEFTGKQRTLFHRIAKAIEKLEKGLKIYQSLEGDF